MRKFIVFAACLIACNFLFTVPAAIAATATAWVQADNQNSSAYVEFGSIFTSGHVFGVYDVNDFSNIATNHLDLMSADSSVYKNTFVVENLKVSIDFSSTGTEINVASLDLTSNAFGFYMYDGQDYFINYTFSGGGNQWDLNWNALGVNISANDVSPVPIPTAALLLGSGLVGLVGFRRKMKQ